MIDEVQTHTNGAGCHKILASRLLQLAHDTDRVGLHREAIILATFAATVRVGRHVEVEDSANHVRRSAQR